MLLCVRLWPCARALTTGASCAVLMDADSGRVLYAQNMHEPRLIASITKLMTALVAVENTPDLDCDITVQPEWTGIEGSSIYLQAGEKITMRGLLYGLLLQSGNDAAAAIACHTAGDIAAFARLMNRRAAELGMEHSRFTNPSGLNEEGHYSTAYDMALLARACLRNDVVAEICAARSATVGTRTFYNHNRLLHRYEGCVGMKTGYTERAGRTLVSAAVRNGQTLICVTLNDTDDWNDHETLLDYGFASYPAQLLCRQGETLCTVRVTDSLIPNLPAVAARRVAFPVAQGERLECAVEMFRNLQAPLESGTVVGRATWYLNGEAVADTPLLCADNVGRDICQPRGFFRLLKGRLALAPDGAHLV